METARREFLRIYRLEVAKTILVTVILVTMILAGGIIMQNRISIENEIRQQRANILVALDKQVKEQSEILIRRGIIIENMHRQILKNQEKIDAEQVSMMRVVTQVDVLSDLVRRQIKLIEERLHK